MMLYAIIGEDRPGTLAERLAARMNSPLESDEGVPVADMVHWCHPSAEMVAESREAEL